MSTAVSDPGAPNTPEQTAPLLTVAVVGNPNSGKTTLFNALTGLRQKVGNYPGVTVEKKEGRAILPNGQAALLLDLPGLYSLTPHSPDELIAREILMGLRADTPRPDIILNVVDASNLERNLYLTSQLLDLGMPMVVVLTMGDIAERAGIEIDTKALAREIGVPVCPVIASRKEGVSQLLAALNDARSRPNPQPAWDVPQATRSHIETLQGALQTANQLPPCIAFAEAVSLLMQDNDATPSDHLLGETRHLLRHTREELAEAEIDFAAQAIESRYAWIARVCAAAMHRAMAPRHDPLSFNEKVDRIVLHPVLGYMLFFIVMAIIFQSIFTWAKVPMDWISGRVDWVGTFLTQRMPEGDLKSLIKDGVFGGVGSTVVFLPQILMLFFFISLLEDTGYMARAAFLMDRLMSKVGLHGKSFIPLLSSFACAIPAIMATRTIGDRKARLITILVAPLMSCSARLPVYVLMIGAFLPSLPVLKIGRITVLTLPGLTMIALYFLSMASAFGMAWLFHRTMLKGVSPTFLLELPPYRLPSVKLALYQMLERAWLFLRRAFTIILSISIVLWFLATYPKRPDLPPEQRVAHSFVGKLGHLIEPAIAPLGFNWKMGIGIISSFAAREVFVTTMGTVYSVEDPQDAGQSNLQERLKADTNPRTGKPVFTPLVAVSLMVYYVLAMQCMSTIAVVRRETNSWKWPLFQIAYMTGLAWIASFVVYQGGRIMGWG
jgi:ferrous iron transport protein B